METGAEQSQAAPEAENPPEVTPVAVDPRERAREPFVIALVWIGPLLGAMLFIHLLKQPTVVQWRYWFSIIGIVVPIAIAWLVSRRSPRSAMLGASLAAVYTPLIVMLALLGTRWYLAGM